MTPDATFSDGTDHRGSARRTVPDTVAGLPVERHCLSGWGESAHGWARVLRPRTDEDVAAALRALSARGGSVAARGWGGSYGDAALATGRHVLDLRELRTVGPIDRSTGRVRVGAGATIADLWRAAIVAGFWPAVVPGTMHPTLGGCAAMNVHGKNQYRVGVFGEHVDAVELVTADGTLRRVAAGEPLFSAVLGGLGLLGVVTSLELRLKRVHSGRLHVEALPCTSLEAMYTAFAEREAESDYLVGWIDAFHRSGRGVLHAGRQFEPGEDAPGAAMMSPEDQELPARVLGVLPRALVGPLMQPFGRGAGVRWINRAKWLPARLRGRHHFPQTHAAFAFLLDYVPHWKRIYDPGGLIQYQTFVPKDRAAAVHREILDRSRAAGMPPWLAVLKRHRPDGFLMSHTVDGYSLALDFPVTAANRDALWSLCRELDRVVVDAGGRFYLAKDLTAEPDTLRKCYPNLDRFLAWKRELDPTCVLDTDLARRLELTAAGR